jgi:hypothetical protein
MKMREATSASALLLAALVAGCSGEAEGPEADVARATVRDSAGVRIVENDTMPDATWRIRGEPLFTVGWDPAGPLFTWPQSGRVLPDGGAVVGESSEGTVYRLGSDGSVVETWGRSGEGPGEYQRFDAILLKGDSVVISDGVLRRVTVRAPDGTLRIARLPSGHVLPVVAAAWRDGRFLVVEGEAYSGVGETRSEWVFQTQPVVVADPEGAGADTIADLPHLRRWYGTRGAPPGPVRVKGRAGGLEIGFAWARSDQAEVRWYDDSGRLLQTARWEEEPAPLTSEWRDQLKQVLETAYEGRGPDFVAAQLARLDEDLDLYDGPLPYWERLHVDRLGNVWLSRYPLLGQPPERWRVVARDGRAVGWVDLPGVIEILDITDDRILAVVQNELDVFAVVMLELLKD